VVQAQLTNNPDHITYHCTAQGLTAKGTAPVLRLCRMLVEAGHNPEEPMEVYRGATLALRVRSIGEAAKFTVNESGSPRFVRLPIEGVAKLRRKLAHARK